MNMQKVNDVRDTALKLNDIYTKHPEDFAYIKGWIHCFLHRENTAYQQFEKSTTTEYT